MKAIIDEAGLKYEALALWSDTAPMAEGNQMIDQPILTVHRPSSDNNLGIACIIAPGGGYRILASDHEGLQVAKWLNRNGITAFVLRYRIAPKYHSSVSLLDGLRAVRCVRYWSKDFKIDPDRIGLLGFSAGGHLTVAVGTGWDEGDDASSDPIDRTSSRPDFLVPVYAVTNGEKRGKKADEYTPTDVLVNPSTPPTFLVHTHEDSVVPASQSTLFYDALLMNKVPAELHIFNKGEHGLGLMLGDPDAAQWGELLIRWLRRQKLLTRKERISLAGKIRVEDQAVGMVWVTLIPEELSHPIVRVRVHGDSGGEFLIEESEGPIPGLYAVKVTHESDQSGHSATGIYTLEDARVYETTREIKEGDPLVLDLSEADFKTI